MYLSVSCECCCLCVIVCVNLSVFTYPDSTSEPGAEGAEDAEAVIQSERVSVLTEEVDQLAAFLLQLLPSAAQ